jgi:hypothetical protein
MKDMTIDEFIEIVHPKIKNKVAITQDMIIGSELMLTGVKDVKGERIDPERTYKIDVPAVIKQDHKTKLRLAWLRGKKQGVRRYLAKWLDEDVLEKVMSAL